MNTYKIIFTRENGTQGTDHFTAINERQARKDFGDRYRHSTATIISIELASTNTPATKQQEPDDCEQWPLMKERANRVAERKGESYEWGWLQNKYVQSAARFCYVYYGHASYWAASYSIGVRPAFLIKLS